MSNQPNDFKKILEKLTKRQRKAIKRLATEFAASNAKK